MEKKRENKKEVKIRGMKAIRQREVIKRDSGGYNRRIEYILFVKY